MQKTKFKDKYYANENGVNSRLDEIQATILNLKLDKVENFINIRRKIANIYLKKLSFDKTILPTENSKCKHVYHLFTVYHPKASIIKKKLLKLKIQTRSIYPYPIHKMKAYSKIIKNKNDLKNSEKKSKGIFCLPLYPELRSSEINKIIFSLKRIITEM